MRRHAKAIAAISALLLILALGATIAGAVAPSVTVENAENVDYTTADVKGTVDPGDKETSYHFEYITDAQFSAEGNTFTGASQKGEGSLAAGAGSTPVSATLKSLQPATVYHLRLVASNEDGPAEAIAANTFETKAVTGPTLSAPAISAITSTSAHFAATINPNAPAGNPTAFDVEWHFECTPECPYLSKDQFISADASSHPVSVDAGDLTPGTSYEVTLVAKNAGGTVTSAPQSFSIDPIAPEVGSNASGASKSRAWLAGFVNPWGSPTTYHFEYGSAGPCSANPCSSTPSVDAGEGIRAVFAKATLNGLEPDSAYDYRLIATSQEGGTTAGPDRTIVTSIGLPEGRAYELVSPVQKNGSHVQALPSRTQVAADGNAVIFPAIGSFADPVGNKVPNNYYARRTPDGWLTHNINPPQAGEATLYLEQIGSALISDASEDLSTGVFYSNRAPGEETAVSKLNTGLYLRDDLEQPGLGHRTLLNDCLAPPLGPCATPLSRINYFRTPEFSFAGTSRDFGHVIFESRHNLVLGAEGEEAKLYEWDHGTVRLVGILPDGSPAECEAGVTCSIAGEGAGGTIFGDEGRHGTADTISADGSRVFFTTAPYEFKGQAPFGGRIFMREDHQTTVRVDASERTDCSGDPTCGGDSQPDPESDPTPFGSYFGAADEDGSTVVFTTREQMTDEDHNNRFDLYRADLEAAPGERLTLISQGTNGVLGSLQESDIQATEKLPGVAAISSDGSSVYFTATAQLVASAPPYPATNPGPHEIPSISGLQYVYVWHNSAVTYLGDYADNTGEFFPATIADSENRFGLRSSRLGSDGRIFVFNTISRTEEHSHGGGEPVRSYGLHLTGYDSYFGEITGPGTGCPATHQRYEQESCNEIYAYDAAAGELTCVSCPPTGAVPTGDAELAAEGYGTNRVQGTHLNRALSKDGKRLFFSSPDALAPNDTNGRYDAYVYDIPTGQVRLLSTGSCNCDSFFIEASPDGHDVFFITLEHLVGIDTDKSADLYDARIGGGIAAQNPPPGFECQGDACQPTPTPPNDPTPASASFQGAGNTNERRGAKQRCRQRARKARASAKHCHSKKKRSAKNGKRGNK